MVSGDTTFEPDETFLARLTAPTNAVITDDEGHGKVPSPR